MRLLLLVACVLTSPAVAFAVNPATVQRGQQLFTQPFSPGPQGPSGDGLGPLFNHVSCVACHHRGGVGGAGDHRFNARSFAISELYYDPSRTSATFGEAIAAINPLLRSGEMVNVIPIARHGGSSKFDHLRRLLMLSFNPQWEDEQNFNSDFVRAESSQRTFSDSSGAMRLQAHVFARNTTPLFGTGLIDQIPESAIKQQVKAQQRFPDIHGRPATLADGRIGKFGWRANFATLLEFNENACVNELGLQTLRVPQALDTTTLQYRNSGVDIDDDSIKAMTQFVASLPAPVRAVPTDAHHSNQISLGENRFAAVGCAICHVPDLGPAKGIYSDLLLHDMGPTSIDYSSAPPYRKNYDLDYEKESRTAVAIAYYGTPAFIGDNIIDGIRREFVFRAPERPSRTVTSPARFGRNDDEVTTTIPLMSRGAMGQREEIVMQRVWVSETIPTNVNQEWRTPPLWGLRDSAPYMHDGRAETILEAIAMHGGEAARTRNRFYVLSYEEQLAVVAFLESLVAPTRGVIPAPKDFTHREVAAY
jgi:CxxC motif-containing protein (DUF1111 family)